MERIKISLSFLALALLLFGCKTTEKISEDEEFIEVSGVRVIEINPEELSQKTNIKLEELRDLKARGFYYNEENGSFVMAASHRDLLQKLIPFWGEEFLSVHPNPTSSFVTLSIPKKYECSNEFTSGLDYPISFNYQVIFEEKIIYTSENSNSYGTEEIPENILQKDGIYRVVCNIEGVDLIRNFMVVKK
jgi:hypothetical protein